VNSYQAESVLCCERMQSFKYIWKL
jgi:hypothetical protein